jgi:hypothetical protein
VGVKERPVVRMRDLPLAGRRTFLRWRKRRYACNGCGRTFTESHPELPPRQRVTCRFRGHLFERMCGDGARADVGRDHLLRHLSEWKPGFDCGRAARRVGVGIGDSGVPGDLTGTPVDLVDASLAPGFGSPAGDGQADRVSVAATDGDDDLTLTGRVVVGGTATLTGLPWRVNVSHTEGTLDALAIDTGAGDDTLDTSAFAPETIQLEVP